MSAAGGVSVQRVARTTLHAPARAAAAGPAARQPAYALLALRGATWSAIICGMGKTLQHGTQACYSAGCRRPECKAAWARYIRERKHAAGQLSREQSQIVREIEQGERKMEEIVEQDTDAQLTIPLSPLALQILIELQRRVNARRGEVVDKLLREYGAALAEQLASSAAA